MQGSQRRWLVIAALLLALGAASPGHYPLTGQPGRRGTFCGTLSRGRAASPPPGAPRTMAVGGQDPGGAASHPEPA